MARAELYDLVRAGVISTGFSNPLLIGKIPVPGWNSFGDAVRDGATVRYRIVDPGDTLRVHQQEIGFGVYSPTNATNITSGTLAAAQLPFATTALRGAVISGLAAAHNFVTGVASGTGALQFAQPAMGDLSNGAPLLGITRAQIATNVLTAYTRFLTSDGAPWVAGTASGPMAIQDSASNWWQLDDSGGLNVKWFGTAADGVAMSASVTIASNSTALTVAGAAFTAGDIGKPISISGAGAAGTNALPNLAYRTQTNTGIFFPAAGTVSLTFSGTEGFRFTSGGLSVLNGSATATCAVDANGAVRTRTVTVASLTSAATIPGGRHMVTDSNLAASGNFGAAVVATATGGVTVPVFSDGASWKIG